MKVTNKSTVRVGAAGVAVIGIIVLFLVMFAVERIDSGQTGIIVNLAGSERGVDAVSYTHLRAHETGRNLVCRLLLEKKKKKKQ